MAKSIMTPLKTGLVSITFRKFTPEELIPLVVQAGQQGLEWGGDVHVPHGDTARAEAVGRRTREAGLEVAAYGSYYRAAAPEKSPEIEAVLDSAEALGAPSIRVWAGNTASAAATDAQRRAVEDDLRRICGLAADRNLRIALEYHGNTLTDETASARALLDALPLPNLDTLWQPPNGKSLEHCLESLDSVLDRVSNLHVFQWKTGWSDRRPLAEGQERWSAYLRRLPPSPARWALLEFVPDDLPENYLRDAKVLREWLTTD